MSGTRIAGLLVLLAGILGLGAALALTRPWQTRIASEPFSLTATTGRPFTQDDLALHPHLVFFGFTHCPDICPTTLTQLSQVLALLPDRSGELRAYFVTVDPERDTPEVMASYLASFDSRLVGLTGSRPEIDTLIGRFRAVARKVPTAAGYVYDHSTAIYMVDRRGRRVGLLDLDRPVPAILGDLQALVARR